MLDQSAIDSDPGSFEPHLPTVNDCHGRLGPKLEWGGLGYTGYTTDTGRYRSE